tara:strand:+ start:163 stop:291 length:129 start_codon:yes stop_codon:yes gene_type:complete
MEGLVRAASLARNMDENKAVKKLSLPTAGAMIANVHGKYWTE